MSETFRLDVSSAYKALNTLSGKLDELRNAKSNIEKARWLIKADDIISTQYIEQTFYRNMDNDIEKIKKCNKELEELLSTAQNASNAFQAIDNERRSLNSEKKKTTWTDVFKWTLKGTGLFTIATVETAFLGYSGVMATTAISAANGLSGNSKNTSLSVTSIKKSDATKKINTSGEKIDKQYNTFKENRKAFIEQNPQYGFGQDLLIKSTYDGEDCFIIKNNNVEYGEYKYWDQNYDRGNNERQACPAFSEAAYHNMVENTNSHRYMDYWDPVAVSWDNISVKRISEGHENVLNTAYERLDNGSPSIVSVNSSGSGTDWHTVVVTGVKSSAIVKKNSGGQLEMSDFIIYDPWNGAQRTLDRAGNHTDNVSCSKLWGT